jgi:hypothetical protein
LIAVAGGDFSLGFRTRALETRGDLTDQTSSEHHHFPYARRLRVGWSQDAEGRWTIYQEDKRSWEVFCAECGDTDGPAEDQSEAVQRLRGPYSNEHKAKHLAEKHFEEN